MADPKKVSRRLGSTSGRMAAGPSVKKTAPKPRADDGGEAMFSDEPLIGGDDDVPLVKEENPIKVDNSLISEDTLNASDNSDMRKRFKHIQANKSTQTLQGVSYPAPAAKPEPEAAKPAPKVSAKMPAADKPKPSVSGKSAPASVSKKMPAAKVEKPIASAEDLDDEDLDEEDDDIEGIDDAEGEDDEALDAKKKKKADEELWENPLEKKKADSDEDEEEEEDEKPAKGNRITRRMSGGSSRSSAKSTRGTKRVKDGDDDTRKSTRKTVREEGGGKKGIPKKFIVIGGVVVFAVLFVLLGLDPLMRHLATTKLETGATIEDRKSAAESLHQRYLTRVSIPLGIFAKHIASPDPMLREAAVYGMELLGKEPNGRADVISKFKDDINGVDPAGKVLFVSALNNIAKTAVDDGKGGSDEASIKAIAAVLLPLSEAEAPPEVRAVTVEGLGALRAPGVCKQLLKIASTETGPLKEKARAGIANTALPDAAGELLRKMKDPDAALAGIAQNAFVRVRDAAKSEDLLPLVSDPSDEVRTKIVEALAKRSGDPKAAQGITTAMSDAKPEIRLMAIKAVPTTHSAPPLPQLTALITDPNEEVSIANAEVISKLRDEGSKNVLLGAFKNDLQGKRMDAYISALGKRSTSTVKDFASIGMVINMFQTHPAAEKSICEALVFLTLAGQGEKRAQVRRGWGAAKWQSWWTNINEREKLRKVSLEKIKALAGKKDADRANFKAYADGTRDALTMLEKVKEMCSPDDPEDVAALDKEIHDGTRQQEYFFKSAGVDMRR